MNATPDSIAKQKRTVIVCVLRMWAWAILTKAFLGILCLGWIAEGLRFFLPTLGVKLHRTAGLGFLKNYVETKQLDWAPFAAAFFLLSVWILLENIIRMWLRQEEATKSLRWNVQRQWTIIFALGVILFAVDATLFYFAVAGMSWGGSLFSLPALMATIAYVAVIIFTSYVAVCLKEDVHECKKHLSLLEESQ